jgi:hypothetical protein
MMCCNKGCDGFINLTNHKSALWGEKQLRQARQYGEIADLPFPSAPADADEQEVIRLAAETVSEVCKRNPKAVLCQGEYSLCFQVVKLLKQKGIKTLCACSDRKTVEKTDGGGHTEKLSVFEFVRFREYQ